MPYRNHSSARIATLSGKRPNSHINLTTLPVASSGQLDQSLLKRRQSVGGSQSTLVQLSLGPKTKLGSNHHPTHNLVTKKKPLSGLSKKESTNRRNKQLTESIRTPKKGAFRSALLGDEEDDDDEAGDDKDNNDNIPLDDHHVHDTNLPLQSSSQLHNPSLPVPNKEDEWLSEPSTRCPTPTSNIQQPVPPSSPLPLLRASEHASPSFVPEAPSSVNGPDLGLQLPNPLSPMFLPLLPTTLSEPNQNSLAHDPDQTPIIHHSDSLPSIPTDGTDQRSHHLDEPQEANRGRSRSRNRLQDSIERAQRLERSRASHDASRDRESASVSRPDPQPHSPPLINPTPICQDYSPPSLTQTNGPTTKGKGKALPKSAAQRSAHRTSINSIRSLTSLVNFHRDSSQQSGSGSAGTAIKRIDSSVSVVLPPKVDTTEAVVALGNKILYNPSLQAIPDLDSADGSQPGPSSQRRRTSLTIQTDSANSPPSKRHISSPTMLRSQLSDQSNRVQYSPGTLTSSQQSELAQRLKKFAPAANRRSHYINLNNMGDSHSQGLMSSLLSPRISFKSRKPVLTPGTAGIHTSGGGYFDSFKSLVGMTSVALEEQDEGMGKDLGGSNQSGSLQADSTRSQLGFKAAGSTTTQGTTNYGSSPDMIVAKSATEGPGHLTGPRRPRPVKMREAKPALSGFITTCGSVPVVSKFVGPRVTSEVVGQRATSIMGGNRIGGGRKEETSGQAGAEMGGGRMTRIQKKLLMERDRPISPTLGEANRESKTETTETTGLPGPSYLIRSLGGQTGPLPFMPMNLMSETTDQRKGRLNEPAMRAKQALSMKIWRDSLIDEVEQVLSDHESNIRFRQPIVESLDRVCRAKSQGRIRLCKT